MSDYYEMLGVERRATQEELKRAYRRLARKHHPDANPGDPNAESRFKELNKAYEALSDPERRSLYDRFGTDDPKKVQMSDPFADGLSSLFETFFGAAAPFADMADMAGGRSAAPRGEDIEGYVDLELRDVVFGVRKDVKVRTAVVCGSCEGSGARSGMSPVRCVTCGGTGQVRQVRQSLLGQMVSTSVCGDCEGFGERIEQPCSSCKGYGRSIEDVTYPVEVPAGVENGTKLRLTGKGAVGPRGGPSGDLYVHLRVRPHPCLRREGNNLVHEMHIPFTQAALGVERDYETFDGSVSITIKSGTETGKELKLPGKGVPYIRGRGRGDLLVRFVVDVPDDLTAEQAQLIRELAELRGEDVAPPSRDGLLKKLRSALT